MEDITNTRDHVCQWCGMKAARPGLRHVTYVDHDYRSRPENETVCLACLDMMHACPALEVRDVRVPATPLPIGPRTARAPSCAHCRTAPAEIVLTYRDAEDSEDVMHEAFCPEHADMMEREAPEYGYAVLAVQSL